MSETRTIGGRSYHDWTVKSLVHVLEHYRLNTAVNNTSKRDNAKVHLFRRLQEFVQTHGVGRQDILRRTNSKKNREQCTSMDIVKARMCLCFDAALTERVGPTSGFEKDSSAPPCMTPEELEALQNSLGFDSEFPYEYRDLGPIHMDFEPYYSPGVVSVNAVDPALVPDHLCGPQRKSDSLCTEELHESGCVTAMPQVNSPEGVWANPNGVGESIGRSTRKISNPEARGIRPSGYVPVASQYGNIRCSDDTISRAEAEKFETREKLFLSPDAEPSNGQATCSVCSYQLTAGNRPDGKLTTNCNHCNDICLICVARSLQSQVDSKMWNQLSCPVCDVQLDHGDVRKYATADVFAR